MKKQKVYKLELEVLSVKSRYAEVSHPDEADTFSSRYTADYLQHTRALLKEATKTKMTLMNQKVSVTTLSSWSGPGPGVVHGPLIVFFYRGIV